MVRIAEVEPSGRTAFGCACGEELTLDDRLEDEDLTIRTVGGL